MQTTLERELLADMLAPASTREEAACMACGRPLDPERTKLGGAHRFCSTRCLEAYDAGWPVYDPRANWKSETLPVLKPRKRRKTRGRA